MADDVSQNVSFTEYSKSQPFIWIRRLSFLTCFSTLFLIFVGGLVTSTGSGLAVPDWPLSYGMFFPPMVGGVFYEHGHRMVASSVGVFMLALAIAFGFCERRPWVRTLGFVALGAVIVQGLLGGITVLFYLPTLVSVSHGILAQTFFVMTVVLAYSQTREWSQRQTQSTEHYDSLFLKYCLVFIVLIYGQLTLGAIMRHTGSGLAIPDFPKMGGQWFPRFDQAMLFFVNDWRFEHHFDPVQMSQVVFHFSHRLGALILLFALIGLNAVAWQVYRNHTQVFGTLLVLNSFFIVQIFLGILSILTRKDPHLTSFHVVTGAGILGISVLLLLRAAPLSFSRFKEVLYCK